MASPGKRRRKKAGAIKVAAPEVVEVKEAPKAPEPPKPKPKRKKRKGFFDKE